MWKSFHTAGPVFILFRSASDRVSSVRPHRHFHWFGLRCPPRAAGGDQQAGGFRGHCRMTGQTAGKTVKTNKGLLHKACSSPLTWNKHFYGASRTPADVLEALFMVFRNKMQRTVLQFVYFSIILHSVYTAAGSAPRRGSCQDRCGSALRPAK